LHEVTNDGTDQSQLSHVANETKMALGGGTTGGHFSSEAALGTLSLIFWALTITISVKYCLFVMRVRSGFARGVAFRSADPNGHAQSH
jgi:K+ potassium transporter